MPRRSSRAISSSVPGARLRAMADIATSAARRAGPSANVERAALTPEQASPNGFLAAIAMYAMQRTRTPSR